MRHEEKNSSWRIFKFGICPLCRWRRREKSCHFRRREKKDAKKQADKPEKALLDGSAARLQTLEIRWCRQNEMRSRIAVHLEMHAGNGSPAGLAEPVWHDYGSLCREARRKRLWQHSV